MSAQGAPYHSAIGNSLRVLNSLRVVFFGTAESFGGGLPHLDLSQEEQKGGFAKGRCFWCDAHKIIREAPDTFNFLRHVYESNLVCLTKVLS